jgi:anti-anti-sigma factor
MGQGVVSSERVEPGIEVITFSGEHDLNTTPQLRDKLTAAIQERVPVVVDLSGADFIDSSILGEVLDARHRAEDTGLGFAVVLTNGAPSVGRVLEVTGLDSSLPVHKTRAAAIKEARAGPSGG